MGAVALAGGLYEASSALKANGIITDDAPDCITLTVKQARGSAQTTIHVRREA